MKKICIVGLIIVNIIACNSNNKSTEEKSEPPTVAQTIVNSPLLGSYVGPFGDNKITLLITKVIGDTVEGRSVVGGNDRPFSGLATLANDIYTINAKEPGDNKYDGTFVISFDKKMETQ